MIYNSLLRRTATSISLEFLESRGVAATRAKECTRITRHFGQFQCDRSLPAVQFFRCLFVSAKILR